MRRRQTINEEVGAHQTLTADAMTLDFPASLTMRTESLLFISHPAYGILF